MSLCVGVLCVVCGFVVVRCVLFVVFCFVVFVVWCSFVVCRCACCVVRCCMLFVIDCVFSWFDVVCRCVSSVVNLGCCMRVKMFVGGLLVDVCCLLPGGCCPLFVVCCLLLGVCYGVRFILCV